MSGRKNITHFVEQWKYLLSEFGYVSTIDLKLERKILLLSDILVQLSSNQGF